jgi:hypothetical protein
MIGGGFRVSPNHTMASSGEGIWFVLSPLPVQVSIPRQPVLQGLLTNTLGAIAMKLSLVALIVGCAVASPVFALMDTPPTLPPHAAVMDTPPTLPPHQA